MNLDSEMSDSAALVEKRSLWRRSVDAVFGYDYFISYTWADGRVYATKLAEALQNSGFECFLDSSQYRAGDDWRKVGYWTLRRTTSLIIVGSPEAVRSEPVFHETQTFQRFNNRIVPIDFDGSLDPKNNNSQLLSILTADIIRLKESLTCLETGPSDAVIRRLHDDFKGVKQSQRRARLLGIATLTFAIIAVVAIWMFLRAEAARRETLRQNMINLAQKLSAEAVNEMGHLEHERAALLARQAYLLNQRHRGNSISRVDYALRSALVSSNFNTFYDSRSLGAPAQTQIRSIAYSPKRGLIVIAGNSVVGLIRPHEGGATWTRLEYPNLHTAELAMSSDQKTVAVVGLDRSVLLYDLSASDFAPKTLTFDHGKSKSVAFSANGGTLVVGTDEGEIHAWNLTNSDFERRLVGRIQSAGVSGLFDRDKLNINSIALSPDSRKLAIATFAGPIVLMDFEGGEQRTLMDKSASRSNSSIEFSPDGTLLAAASTSPACVWIWRTDQSDLPPMTHKLQSPLSIVYSSDGRNLVSGNGLGKLYVWNTEQLEIPPVSMQAHRDEIRALSAVPGDQRYISGSRDGTLRIWEPYSDAEAEFRWGPGRGARVIGPALHDSKWIAFDPISRSGVSRGSDGTVELHQDIGAAERVTRLDVKGNSAAFSSTGKFLAVGLPSQPEAEEDDPEAASMFIWDLTHLGTPTKIGWRDQAEKVSTGQTRAESTKSGIVEIYQASEPAGDPATLEIPDSSGSAPSLSILRDGDYLLTINHPSERFDVTRVVGLHLLSSAALAENVCLRVRRNLSQEEWQRFIGPSLEYERTCPNLPAGP